MKKTIGDIDYVLKDFLEWGEQIDVLQEMADEVIRNVTVKGIDKDPQLELRKINIKDAQIKQVLRALESWTFKGYDDEKRLRTEGEVLPINMENLRRIPASHGTVLARLVDRLNTIPEEVEKK